MRFYFNEGANTCATEEEAVEDILNCNPDMEEETAINLLHTC